MKLRHIFFSIVTVTSFLLPVSVALANPFDRASKTLTSTGNSAQLGNPEGLEVIVGRVINVALSFSGMIVLCYIIYAGFLWLTAAGDSKQVDKAKDILRNAVIGLLILAAAYAISTFVFSALKSVTQGSNGTG